MTGDPLITAALLGAARSPDLPPAPDPSLDEVWQSIPRENPAAALLHALALTRCLHRAGAKSLSAGTASLPCPPETREPLPPAAIESARRLLTGDYSELLDEWLRLATATGKILPARVLPEFLSSATRNPALRSAVPALAGERGFWIAKRHPDFSWLAETSIIHENAWDEGTPAERLAWLRHTRAADPTLAANAIASHWKDEDAGMRESIVRLVAEKTSPCDQEWLEKLALKDRRQEIRDSASAALMILSDSDYRRRAIDRARGAVRIERRLLKRIIHIEPPAAFDPAWAADGIKEKPAQGTGEKAWWLRQIIAMIPIDDWPGLLDIDQDSLFKLNVDPDWHGALILGWIDSATRLLARSLPGFFLPYLATLEPWPLPAVAKTHLLSTLLSNMDETTRFPIIERIAQDLTIDQAIDLLARVAAAPPPGQGRIITAIIDKSIHGEMANLIRPQTRALAACIPADAIQGRLEIIAKLAELTTAIETFATTLEFRRSMISQLTSP